MVLSRHKYGEVVSYDENPDLLGPIDLGFVSGSSTTINTIRFSPGGYTVACKCC
jgi:hypothetical protein